MTKELIQNLRSVGRLWEDEAADTIEAQQSWITSLEQHAQAADKLYKELETELAAAQAQIKVLRDALEAVRDQRIEGYVFPAVVDLNAWHSKVIDALAQPTDDSALQAAIAEYKQDAERYRFFIKHLDITDQLSPLHILMSKIGDRTPTKVELDAAIDAAMEKVK